MTALNAEYSDNGLVGALVSCPAEAADGIVRAAVSALKSINVSDADIQRGKALLKANVLDQAESGRTLVEEIGQQALLLGKVSSAKELAQAIDSVSQNDVLNVSSIVIYRFFVIRANISDFTLMVFRATSISLIVLVGLVCDHHLPSKNYVI